MAPELTREDLEVLKRTPNVSREAFEKERERELSEAGRLLQSFRRDGDGLTEEDKILLRRNPHIDRKSFIETRRKELEEKKR